MVLLLLPTSLASSQQSIPSTINFASNEQNVTVLGAHDSDRLTLAKGLAFGDVNGDGKADLIVGAPGAGTSDTGRASAGAAYIVYGKANPSLTIDLAQDSNRTAIFGAASGDGLGTAVAAGDLNGDSFADVAISAPNASGPRGNRAQAGAVYVFRGNPTLPTQVDLATASPDMTVIGVRAGDHLGESLVICDLNGDGLGDLVIGDPRASGPGGAPGVGAVYIIFGQLQFGGLIDLAATPADVTIYGNTTNGLFGASLACGDVNGDGRRDLLIGSPFGQNPSRVSTGAVYVILGKAALPSTIDLSTTSADLVIYGAATGDQLGAAVAAGDLNGDNIDDMAMSAPGAEDARGAVYVFFGRNRLAGPLDLSTANVNMTILGAQRGDRLGDSLTIGDINSDGFKDLLIGEVNGPGSLGLLRPGAAYLILGSANPPANIDLGIRGANVVFTGANTGSQLGASVALGDFDGDGAADIALGAPFSGTLSSRPNAGVAYVVFGSRFGTPKPAALKGDVNLDGKVDILDAQLLVNYLVGLAQLNDRQKWEGDVTPPCIAPDANIDINDVRTIAEFTVGNIKSFDCSLTPPK